MKCEHCGTEVREQIYDDVPKPYEVEGSCYHSATRCRDAIKTQRDSLAKMADEQAYMLVDYMTCVLEATRHLNGKCDCHVKFPDGGVSCLHFATEALSPFVETGPPPEFEHRTRPFAMSELTAVRQRAMEKLRAKAAQVDTMEAAASPETWEDRPDQWTLAVRAAFPTNSGSHETYATAMKMVGNRHGKGALIGLVNWLLMQIEEGSRP